jgi:hypothetical protein
MRKIIRFMIAGMLGLLTLPALGAGRGNAQAAHVSSVSPTARHVSTHSPKPPKVPSVGGAAPAPVHKAAPVNTTAAETGAGAVVDDDPVEDLVPVSDSPSEFDSPTTNFQPSVPSYDEIESRNSRINSSGPLRAGTDAPVTNLAPATSDALWAQIDAASSHTQAVLNNKPQYWAAVARLESAEQKVAALRTGGQKDSDQIRLAAQIALEARREIAQMQTSTLEADPNFQAALTRNEPAAVVPGQSQ